MHKESVAEELTTVDIFNQMTQILFSRLEPLGWKLLKNGDIKKKSGKLTYKIFFFRSYKNYINYNAKSGSVTTEIYCYIDTAQREGVYALKFEKPSSFNILSENLTLNTVLVEQIWKIIEQEFLEVIQGLEKNPRQQLLKTGLFPIRYAIDYSYELSLRRELLEAVGATDLLHIYTENSNFYKSPENSAVISMENYYYTIRDRVNVDYCKKVSLEELSTLADEAYSFLRQTDRYDEFTEAKYQYVKSFPKTDRFKSVIAVFWFVYPGIAPWFEKDPNAQHILKKVLDFEEKLIVRKLRKAESEMNI
ncbi:hypothetical protein [Sphingobacterium yanglingense]|uniref:Uncharacterized protein n=1 Tax=Sphingobacterium yanglingense TaxID=1437280 RepID=A0A4R6WAL6_9SPHI|nr:hypothetical protein [Sphingobacterium yanglingense]TDQ73925.1 hypothetical protein CLV99_4363 [Sphingobacterium yanglingense]